MSDDLDGKNGTPHRCPPAWVERAWAGNGREKIRQAKVFFATAEFSCAGAPRETMDAGGRRVLRRRFCP
jgi:hypothetical protein